MIITATARMYPKSLALCMYQLLILIFILFYSLVVNIPDVHIVYG